MSDQWRFSSPHVLLGEWQDRADEAELHELVLLGFTVDLPFLEKVAIPAARAMGARITVVGDAAQGLYDPVDVRLAGRSYFHGHAWCQGAFHPKLALLIGEREVVAAIGSGNPTMAGWGYNDELWTVLRGGDASAPAAMAQLGAWLELLPDRVAMPEYAGDLLRENAARLSSLQTDAAGGRAQVLHNLDTGLLGQLPGGPVEELCLYAPFVDQTGKALAEIMEHFDPARVVIGVQERWTSYDGDAILRAVAGREVELRLLPEQVPRHGKLLEWRTAGSRQALTGSANLTASALIRATREGGNCELAVLAAVETSLMPEGAISSTTHLQGRRTVSAVDSRPSLFLLGALLTSKGLQVALARPYEFDVTIETSPDGSPGSWTVIGTIAAGDTVRVFAVPESAGAVVRAIDARPNQARAESPPVDRPKLRHAYTEEEIFTDEEMARRFRYDLLRLSDQLTQQKTAHAAVASPRPATSSAVEDRWAAYLENCERTLGRPLTSKLFGRLVVGIPGTFAGLGWGLAVTATIDDTAETNDLSEEAQEETSSVLSAMPSSERQGWRNWISRAVDAVAPAPAGAAAPPGRPVIRVPPLVMRILVARLFIQLLGHGVWDLDDDSWREDLARLTQKLVPDSGDDEPAESLQHAAVLAAVCMGLLRSEASLTGGTPADVPAARTWPKVKSFIAEADPELATDLLIAPVLPRAQVLSRFELENLLQLAAHDDPLAPLKSELLEAGLELELDGQLYEVTGAFSNPVPVAARVATLLGQHLDTALVHASANGRWAFIAWRRPDLLLVSAPTGYAWRFYRVTEPATPESRLGTSEGLSSVGMVGRPVRLGLLPPEPARRLLDSVGIDHIALLERLISGH
jgi:hypothetical protein